MKISSVEILPINLPMRHPYGEVTTVPAAVASLRTDDSLVGYGHVMTLYGRQFADIVAAAEELGQLVVGEDPSRPELVHHKMLGDHNKARGAVAHQAAAVLDVAIWDLASKSAGLPLYRLLGGYRNRVPAYASLRLGRSVPTGQLADIARSLLDQGFRALKMNLAGQPNVEQDIERVRLVRETIGPDVKLLADANGRWTPSEAIRAGQLLDDLHLFWLEDPVPLDNLSGLAEVRHALRTPIAAGETLYELAGFREIFEARTVDFPMPDLARMGGITPYRKVAHLAEAFGLPLACHLLPEISIQVLAAVPNAVLVEYVPWGERLFRGFPELFAGDLFLSERPGHGMELDIDFAKHYRMT